jgi:hypothetical protein
MLLLLLLLLLLLFTTAKKGKRIARMLFNSVGIVVCSLLLYPAQYYTPTDRPSGGPHAARLGEWGVGRAAGPPAFVLVLL